MRLRKVGCRDNSICRGYQYLADEFEDIACSELTVHGSRNVQSSIMANKNSIKESEEAILRGIKEEMAKPRIAKSARRARPELPRVFPLSGSQWPGLARPTRSRIISSPSGRNVGL